MTSSDWAARRAEEAEDRRQRAIQAGRNLMDAYNVRHGFSAVMGHSMDDGSYEFIISEGKP
jgi:hypothetical protein